MREPSDSAASDAENDRAHERAVIDDGDRSVVTGDSGDVSRDTLRADRDDVTRDTLRDIALAALLAFALAGISYALNGNAAMRLQDEGFLWYGVVHTLHGEVPLRDFRSYDPARYYWCAAWAEILGDGFLALRLACAIFAGVGLTFGLLAAHRAVRNRWMLVPIGVILALWFFPPYKTFEAGVALASVFTAVKLVERPSAPRHFAAGVAVGIAALFGRNLGVYSALGFLALIAFLRIKLTRASAQVADASSGESARAPGARELGSWALGVIAGYAPMLGMIAFVPGFRASFVDSVLFYVRQNTLNAPLPVPWPWAVELSGVRMWQAASELGIGLCFLFVPIFYAAALVIALRTNVRELRRRALFLSALALGIVYAHHATVRSDVSHLAQCIHPFLLGVIAIPTLYRELGPRVRRSASIAIIAALFVLSFLAIARHQPLGYELAASRTAHPFVPYDARGDTVWINRAKAEHLAALTAAVNARVKPEEKLWISPTLLTLYPLLGRSSPVWDIYPAWRASAEDEARMLSEIADVKWILWMDQPSDGDDVLQLSNSHPSVWRELQRDFERVPTPELGSAVMMLHRKSG